MTQSFCSVPVNCCHFISWLSLRHTSWLYNYTSFLIARHRKSPDDVLTICLLEFRLWITVFLGAARSRQQPLPSTRHWSFHVQIRLCRLAQNSAGMRRSSFYWMHKFGKSKHWSTVFTTRVNPPKACCQIWMCAHSQSHSSMLSWYLCQCGPLRWNYCHSWRDDSLQVIKEVMIQKHLGSRHVLLSPRSMKAQTASVWVLD